MRWEALFADLEAEFAAHDAVDADSVLRDRVRRETALLRLVDRLRPARGSELAVHVTGGVIRGRLVDAGSDWLLLAESASRDALIPLAAVASVAGLGRWSATPGSEGHVGGRLDLGYALRGIGRDRAGVAVLLIDGATCAGTIDRVGKDFIEVAEHPAAEPRRAGAVSSIRAVPHAAIVVVRSA